jgi:hypothetical protein
MRRRRVSRPLHGVAPAHAVPQPGRYPDTVGLHHGWLVVFDVRPDKTWEERLWTRGERTQDGKRVVVLVA